MRDKSLWKKNQGQPALSTSLYEITTAINHFCSCFFAACDVNYHYRGTVRSWFSSWRNIVGKTIAALSLYRRYGPFLANRSKSVRRLRNEVKASSLNARKNLTRNPRRVVEIVSPRATRWKRCPFSRQKRRTNCETGAWFEISNFFSNDLFA